MRWFDNNRYDDGLCRSALQHLFSRVVKTAFLIATLLPNITMQVTVFQIVYKLGLYRSMLAPII